MPRVKPGLLHKTDPEGCLIYRRHADFLTPPLLLFYGFQYAPFYSSWLGCFNYIHQNNCSKGFLFVILAVFEGNKISLTSPDPKGDLRLFNTLKSTIVLCENIGSNHQKFPLGSGLWLSKESDLSLSADRQAASK